MISDSIKRWLKQFRIAHVVRSHLTMISDWLTQFRIVHVVRSHLTPRKVSNLRIIRGLPTFSPNSGGRPEALAQVALQSAEMTFPSLIELARVFGHRPLEPIDAKAICRVGEDQQSASRLKDLFDKYGSDKARKHDYHHLYGHILSAPDNVRSVLEIGLGTNNTDVVSSMGVSGRPGASLRAFRDYLPQAEIFGADVDRRVLFEESRISTFFVDQTDWNTVAELGERLPDSMDLIIDDGLHAPDANIAIMRLAVQKLKIGGWVVIEDVPSATTSVWQIVSFLIMHTKYECSLIKAVSGSYLFAARRVS